MLLNLITNDSNNYIHVKSLMRTEYTILYNSEDSFIIHFHESNIYIAESVSNSLKEFASIIQSYKPDLLETTNQALFRLTRNDFINSYECYQYGPFVEKISDENLFPLLSKDLPYVCATYHNEKYLQQLFERNRLLGYYKENELIGYIAKHVDGTLGALYVNPQYRNRGYGKQIIKAATAYFDDSLMYSQVVDNNTESINLHNKLNINKSSKKICWMYNIGFSF